MLDVFFYTIGRQTPSPGMMAATGMIRDSTGLLLPPSNQGDKVKYKGILFAAIFQFDPKQVVKESSTSYCCR